MARLTKFAQIAILMVQLLLAAETRGQPSPFNYDLDFEARMREALAEMREIDDDEARSRQRAFAQEAFNYYRQNRILRPAATRQKPRSRCGAQLVR